MNIMDALLKKTLPKKIAKLVIGECCDNSQDVRAFCAHYTENPSALTHFSVKQLVESPDLWFVSTVEGKRRQQWLEDSYPKHIERPIEITDSILKCGKCQENTVDYYEKQTRGADEPMTVFAHCLTCGKRWTQ